MSIPSQPPSYLHGLKAYPAIWGRAVTRKAYVRYISSDNRISRRNAEDLLRQALRASREGRETPSYHKRVLREAPIGRYVIWASFSGEAPETDPFGRLPRTTEAIRTALGLGHIDVNESLVLITYNTEAPDVRIELYRPTIAEAAEHAHFRPCREADSPHGWTSPLPPNHAGLDAQPEVVHPEVRGRTLVFPIHEAR